MPYPNTYDAPDISMQGTTTVAGDDHALNHRLLGSAVGTIEHVLGTTNGTQVLMNFAAGDFASRINSGGTLQQTLFGTLNNGVLGTPQVTGGTIGTATVTGGTVNANYLTTASGSVNIGTATAPSSGQALVATGASGAAWKTPSGALQGVYNTTTIGTSSTSSQTDVNMVSVAGTPSGTVNLLVLVTVDWQQSNIVGTNLADIQMNGTVQGNNPLLETDFFGTVAGKNISMMGHCYIPSVSSAATITLNGRVGTNTTTLTLQQAALTVFAYNA